MLETSKAFLDTDIPAKVVKGNADIFANVLASNFNDSIEKFNFPSILKYATITPVFKKGDRNFTERLQYTILFISYV